MAKLLALIACLLWAPLIELHAQTPPARQQFIYVLRVLPPFHTLQAWTDKETTAVGRQFERLAQATAPGQVILAGGTTEPPDRTLGIVIFEADNEQAAREFMQADPAVVAGVMSATLHPYALALQRQR